MNQRWRERRESYRPTIEPIDTRAYEVAPISGDAEPKKFVCDHHYSGSYPAARFRFGLYRGPSLVGVAVFSNPCNDRVLTSVFPAPVAEMAELGRFVLLDDVPGNGESWFIARCFELLRKDLVGVVSASDPEPRTRLDGTLVHPGHVGTIYQATNGRYYGRSKARTLLILPDGTVFSERSAQKIRNGERGARYAAEILVSHGATRPEGDVRVWLAAWTARLCRPMRHPGNHRYAWALDRGMKRHLPDALPYPKKDAA